MWERIQWKHILPYINSIAFSVPVAVVFIEKIGCISKVEGVSMQPVLNPEFTSKGHDYVFVNKLASRGYNFQRGEIVSLHSPKDPSKDLIKRIIALEDDIVISRKHSTVLTHIPTGHCWVEGDNTMNSMDSNNFGPKMLDCWIQEEEHG